MQISGWNQMTVGMKNINKTKGAFSHPTVLCWLCFHSTIWCLADQNECVLAPSEPTEFSLYVHNLQNVERRGHEVCVISQPVHHHHDSLIFQHRGCIIRPVPSPHTSPRLTAVEIWRPVQTEWKDVSALGNVSITPLCFLSFHRTQFIESLLHEQEVGNASAYSDT